MGKLRKVRRSRPLRLDERALNFWCELMLAGLAAIVILALYAMLGGLWYHATGEAWPGIDVDQHEGDW